MDAIEKIARIIHDSLLPSCNECDLANQSHPHRQMAVNLIAAFPQLALEGHQTHGYRLTYGDDGSAKCSYDLDLLRRKASVEHGDRIEVQTTTIFATTSGWSEVQS